MPNELANALSPYLQQHKDNPVQWCLWSEENLQRARRENKPIFLSIGYSSCHWCHVMERESFSDAEIAQVLNEHFIPIKVDREERPDLDHLYMQSLQMMTGQGGWPLNVFLTPELRPYFGGTYFPKEARYGRPPFKEVLLRLHDVFQNQRDLVEKNATQLTGLLAQNGQFFASKDSMDSSFHESLLKNLRASIDKENGGLGGAPKFFHVDGLRNLLQTKTADDLALVELSLNRMAGGGVYDHLGGGFHRYSTDAEWKVPHFEKMLYDNALLAVLYTEAFQVTQNACYQRIAFEILDWAIREMTDAKGRFYSAIDADSEHEEGAFYIWSAEEIRKMLSESDFNDFSKTFHLSPGGNFEKRNIIFAGKLLDEKDHARWSPIFKQLYEIRNSRVRPLTDTKIQTSWNGLMISALARSQEKKYLEAAQRVADALIETAWNGRRLAHSQMNEKVLDVSFLEDSAYLLDGLLDLSDALESQKYLPVIVDIAEFALREFYDTEAGGFWTTTRQQKDLLVRTKEIHDGALPAAYHVFLSVLERLYAKTADKKWFDAFEKSVLAILGEAEERPGGFHRFALVLQRYKNASYACASDNCSVPEPRKVR